MAGPTRREKHEWEAQMASISSAGFRPLNMSALNAPNGGSTVTTYTVSANQLTKRLVIFHDSSGNKDIYFDINNDPTTDSMAIIPGAYFVLEVEQAETVRFINSSGGTVHIHFMEIR